MENTCCRMTLLCFRTSSNRRASSLFLLICKCSSQFVKDIQMKIRKRKREGLRCLCQGHFVMALPCCVFAVCSLQHVLCSMFFAASEPRSPLCFGCLSKVSWAFKIKTGVRSPLVEKLLTFPFPDCTVSYWQH